MLHSLFRQACSGGPKSPAVHTYGHIETDAVLANMKGSETASGSLHTQGSINCSVSMSVIREQDEQSITAKLYVSTAVVPGNIQHAMKVLVDNVGKRFSPLSASLSQVFRHAGEASDVCENKAALQRINPGWIPARIATHGV